MKKKTSEVVCTIIDIDNLVQETMYKWVQFSREQIKSMDKGIDIEHYIKTKWYEKIIPHFLY